MAGLRSYARVAKKKYKQKRALQKKVHLKMRTWTNVRKCKGRRKMQLHQKQLVLNTKKVLT